eukprot:CAMPEP_0182475266 /NCGR_PEP_ID=MMETSP1319-20130603/27112_1 /TAXON_ID=172717 /ORGANISM="Bolidomonas pacifica, Strain RCC208" /LENGTH=273 /DNA_ID=CAMNT_0024676247 /DNA_START=176 /DNA_END=997 /DNA_ORIENTATION=+
MPDGFGVGPSWATAVADDDMVFPSATSNFPFAAAHLAGSGASCPKPGSTAKQPDFGLQAYTLSSTSHQLQPPQLPQLPSGLELGKPTLEPLSDFVEHDDSMTDTSLYTPPFVGMGEAARVGDVDATRQALLAIGGVVSSDSADQFVVPSPFGNTVVVSFCDSFMYLVSGDESDFHDVVARLGADEPQQTVHAPVPSTESIERVMSMFKTHVPYFRVDAAKQLERWARQHPQQMSPVLGSPEARALAQDNDQSVVKSYLTALNYVQAQVVGMVA